MKIKPTVKERRTKATEQMAQSERFIEAARELQCDDDKGRFEKRLGKIAKAKPKGVKR